MESNNKQVPEIVYLANIPNDKFMEISLPLHLYSTILIRIFTDKYGLDQGIQIGSGTFVTIGKAYGILTAQHVSEQIRPGDRLGIIAGSEGQEHRFIMPRNSIEIINMINQRLTDEYGPDISFIIIADSEKISTIKTHKSFYPLSHLRERLRTIQPSINSGVWMACGAPGENARMISSPIDLGRVMEFRDFVYWGCVKEPYEKDSFDYYEMPTSEGPDETPRDYGGMSGGGLWQVSMYRSPEGLLKGKEYLLMGVIFYQGVGEDNIRYLRGHGPKSIYGIFLDKVQNG
jgi:hypothetical protein